MIRPSCLCGFALLLLLTVTAPAGRAATDRTDTSGRKVQQDSASPGFAAEARQVVQISGNASFPEAEILEAIKQTVQEIKESGLTAPRADDAAYFVGAFYRKRGYSKATSDYTIRGGKAYIRVQEGPRTLLERVNFVGNETFSDGALYDYMIGASEERLTKEPSLFPYTTSDVGAGADRVRGFYISEGFLDVQIDDDAVKFSSNSERAIVTIRIVEGTRYTFGRVSFQGELIFPEHELITAMREPPLGAFSAGRVTAMERNLQSFYKSKGYFTAQVEVNAEPKNAVHGRVNVVFTVHPHGLFRFDGVQVKNTGPKPRLRPDFLPKRFAHLKGQTYDPAKLDETFREMLRTGLFTTLRISTTAQRDNTVHLDLTAEEAKAKEVGFTIGFGSYDGLTLGLRLGDRDLFGNGRPLTLSVDYSQRGGRGELLYVDPWLLDTRFGLRASLYSTQRDETGYSKSAYGARVELSRKLLPHLELGAYLDNGTTKITNASNALRDDPRRLGPTDYFLTSIGISQLTDFRDNPLNPRRGYVFSTSFDYDLLDGAPAFTRSIFRFSYYQPIGKTVLSLGARAGYISPIADAIPIDVRFFNGGGTTVRSFSERELGPKDRSGNPLGGTLYTVFNAELEFPLKGALHGATFIDAGSLENQFEDDSLRGGEMRYAVGLGLRYALPIGALRLDYGVNPNPKDDEDFGAFHFSFGVAF